MKPSRYNYIHSRDNYSYWYNGLNHTWFRLPKVLGEKVQSILTNPDEIKEINEPFFNSLKDSGFIIDNDIDELAKLRKLNQQQIDNKFYQLILVPTLDCNYKCWYCVQSHIPSRMSDETMTRVKKHIKYMVEVEKINSLSLDWFGGEPFMYFHEVIRPLCEYSRKICNKHDLPLALTATTNAYYLDESIIPEICELGFTFFQITLDGPREMHDKVKYMDGCDSAFNRTLHNIECLLRASEQITIMLRINYTSSNLTQELVEQVEHGISARYRNRITIVPKKVWQEAVDKSLFTKTTRILDNFEKLSFNVAKYDIITTFVPCYASRRYCNVINYNGDIAKCTSGNELYGEKVPGHLNQEGIIHWNEDHLSKYVTKGFENHRCIACRYLPICMGACPRKCHESGGQPQCKLEYSDNDLVQSIMNHIDSQYDRQTN